MRTTPVINIKMVIAEIMSSRNLAGDWDHLSSQFVLIQSKRIARVLGEWAGQMK